MPNVTYRHNRTGETTTYSAPHPVFERVSSWSRVDEQTGGYSALRKAELVSLAAERGLDTAGTVAELRERLEADDAKSAEPQS